MFGLSAEANPRAALAALRGIDVRIVGSRERGGQFALPLPAPDGTAFHRESFGMLRPGAARRYPEGTAVGRMTSCAHRLRKPDLTSKPLTSSVAPRPRARGLLCRAPVDALHSPCVMQEGSAAPGSPVTAVGLGQRNPDEPGRLPSDRPEPCGPGGRVAFVVHVHGSPRTLSPAAIRGRPRQRPSWSLQAIPALALRVVGAPSVHVERCLSPTSATDLRTRAPSTDHPIPVRACLPATPRGAPGSQSTDPPSVVGPPADPRVEHRLTATLQLQPSLTTRSPRASGAWAPCARVLS
jgi:hypothetical protein